MKEAGWIFSTVVVLVMHPSKGDIIRGDKESRAGKVCGHGEHSGYMFGLEFGEKEKVHPKAGLEHGWALTSSIA